MDFAGRTSNSREVVLEAEGVSKSFGGVAALGDVDFDLKAGEVHALVGENGAGKSTLMKILAGVHVEYEGVIRLERAPVRFSGVQDAERAGVAIIHQELNLVPELTAADNIFLGRLRGRSSIGGGSRRRPGRCCAGWASTSIRRAASRISASANSNWSKSPRRCRSTRES